MTKRDDQAKEYAEESGSLDGYHPMVRDFILGQGCFSQDKEKEMHEHVWRRLQERLSVAMVEALREGFAAVDKRWDALDQPAGGAAKAIARPFADAAERSSTVSKAGEGQSGMRTERVVLEVTHDSHLSLRDWPSLRTFFGESVRVVSDEEREAALPDVSDQDGDRVAIDWQGLTKVLQAERDAANRERDAAVAESERRLRLCETMKRDGDSARFHAAVAQARVAELEEARKRFDTALEEARDASGINDFIVQRDEAFDERDAAIREREAWKLLADRTNERLSAAEARVAELEAASGGGEGEPVAFGVRMKSGTFKGFLFPSREKASKCAELITDEVVAFFQEPPQPRGWLTEEEREAVQWAADAAYDKQHPAEDTLRSVLARSTPPEVVLPCSWKTIQGELVCLHREVIAALAAAGVSVKEVGK